MNFLPRLLLAIILPLSIVFADYSAWNHSEKIYLRTGPKGVSFPTYVKAIPIPIRLDDSFFDFSQAKPNGEDIRFSDSSGTVALPYEIERWDPAAGKAEIWVEMYWIHKDRDDQYIHMHWGNPAAEDISDGPEVFKRKFEGVYHLNENPPGKGNEDAMWDASENRHQNEYLHGTDYLSQGETREMIGPAPRFNRDSSDYVVIPERGGWHVGDRRFTLAFWAKLSGREQEDWARLLSKDDDNDSLRIGGNFLIKDKKFPGAVLLNDTTDGIDDSTQRHEIFTNTDISDGRWHHIAFVSGNKGLNLYVDGKIRGNLPRVEGDWQNDAPMYLGAFLGEEYFFDGWMDEVWLIRDGKPDEFIKMIYESQRPDQKVIHFGEPAPDLAIITLQPEPASLLTGETLALTVSVNSEDTPSFQWFKDGASVPGATSNSLLIDSMKLSNAGNYHVAISNLAGTVYSDTVLVEVNVAPPKITTHPQSQPAKPGAAATFSITASGEGDFSYQWLLNGFPILGAIDPVYMPKRKGDYSLEIVNEFGCYNISDVTSYIMTSENIVLYPNPSVGKFKIRVLDPMITRGTVSIINPENKIIFTKEFDNTLAYEIPYLFDISGFEQGLYIVKIETPEKVIHEKLVLN